MYKKFGYMMGSVLSGLGLWQLWGRGRPVGGVLIGLGLLFFLIALLKPHLLKIVYGPWMRLGHVLGWVNTRILLLAMYFLVFVPVGLLLKIMRKDALHQRLLKEQASYWMKRPATSQTSGYEKQY
jgi:hypothetical protein